MHFRYLYMLLLCLIACLQTTAQPSRPPQFKGGSEAMIGFIFKHLEYPEHAKEFGIQGIVYVDALVRKTGKLDSLRIIYSRGPETEGELGEEALRITRLMPMWIPGYNRKNQPIEERVRIPYRFKINPDQ